MQKTMLTLAALLLTAQVQAFDKVEVGPHFQTHLPAETAEQPQPQVQSKSFNSNRTVGENNHLYSFVARAKDEVEASRFLLETPISSCISMVTEVGDGPQVCHPATHNANAFIEFEDVVPMLEDYTDSRKLPIEIIDQRHSEVDFVISQDWFDGEVGALSVFYRPDAEAGACDTYANVTKGEWKEHFTAKCYFKKAEVKIYMRWCGSEEDAVCEENCDLCHTPDDLSQYKELSFEIDCDPRCSRPNTAENNAFDPFDLPCEDEDTEQLDGFLGGGAQDCDASSVEVDEENLPIRVVERSRDGETVVFELTQDYYKGSIVKWGVHHRANSTYQDCDVEHDVAYSDTRQFTTKCWYGQAAVTLYVYLCELEPHDDCDVCSPPESMDNFMQYAYNIACYRPCDNDTDIITFDDPFTDPPEIGTLPPEENNAEDPELPGVPNNCTQLVTTVGNGGSTCTVGGEYQRLIGDVEAEETIDIVSATGDTVEFKVSQKFVDGEVFRFSVFYDNAISQHDCNTFMDVVPTWDGTFTAVCFENKAAIKFYFRFCGNNVEEECNFCVTPDALDDYLELAVELDCSETCDPEYIDDKSSESSDEATIPVPEIIGDDKSSESSDEAAIPVPEIIGDDKSSESSDEATIPSGPSGPTPSGPTDGGDGTIPSGPTGPTPSGPSGPTPSGHSGPTPSGPFEPSGSTPSGPSGPTVDENGAESSDEGTIPSGPTGSTPSGPSGPTVDENGAESSADEGTLPSGPTGSTPSGPSGSTPSGPSGPTVDENGAESSDEGTIPSGPTGSTPSGPSGPTVDENGAESSDEGTIPSGPTGSTPSGPSGPTVDENGAESSDEGTIPSGPTGSTPSGPSGPTVDENGAESSDEGTLPSGPTGSTPSGPSGPTVDENGAESSDEGTIPSGPTGSTPSGPSGPTVDENGAESSDEGTIPSGPTGPTPSGPSGPTPSGPSGPTPSGPAGGGDGTIPTGPTPTGPTVDENGAESSDEGTIPSGPAEPIGPSPSESLDSSGDNCSDLTASACPADVVHHSTTGSTVFSGAPIRIQSQTDSTVTFSVDNTFGSVLQNVYIEYYSLADGTATCTASSDVRLCAADGILYTAHCTGGSPQTLIDMWMTDTALFDSVADNASIPNTCGAVSGGSSTVKYTFALYCQSTCAVLPNRRLRGTNQPRD